jgi:hypothetical protein
MRGESFDFGFELETFESLKSSGELGALEALEAFETLPRFGSLDISESLGCVIFSASSRNLASEVQGQIF